MVSGNGSILNVCFIVVSLVVVFIATFGHSSRFSEWVNSWRPLTSDSAYGLWRGLIACVLMAALLILCLIGVNSMKGAVGKLSVNIAILVLLVGDLAAMWSGVKRLRKRRDQNY